MWMDGWMVGTVMRGTSLFFRVFQHPFRDLAQITVQFLAGTSIVDASFPGHFMRVPCNCLHSSKSKPKGHRPSFNSFNGSSFDTPLEISLV